MRCTYVNTRGSCLRGKLWSKTTAQSATRYLCNACQELGQDEYRSQKERDDGIHPLGRRHVSCAEFSVYGGSLRRAGDAPAISKGLHFSFSSPGLLNRAGYRDISL